LARKTPVRKPFHSKEIISTKPRPNSRTERRRKTRIGTEVAHVTRTALSRSKVKVTQAALLSAALTREAGAAVTVRTY